MTEIQKRPGDWKLMMHLQAHGLMGARGSLNIGTEGLGWGEGSAPNKGPFYFYKQRVQSVNMVGRTL